MRASVNRGFDMIVIEDCCASYPDEWHRFSIDNIISYTSRYVTLEPGDVVFTGTPGTTRAMKPGDTFEVEIEGVGVLRNKVVAAKAAGATSQP